MVFLPQFATVLENTYELDKAYKKLYRIYILDAKDHGLEYWIKKVEDGVLKCKTKRTSQRDVFKILTTELRGFLNTASEAKGIMILIGALLHRYFRLIVSYEKKDYSFFTSMFTDVFECDLFKSIRKALGLDEGVDYTNYRELDDITLDFMSVITCLEMFKNFMILNDENGKERWVKYNHFKEEPAFIRHLDELIVDKKTNAKTDKNYRSMSCDSNAIQFIKSLAGQLKDETLTIATQLQEWGNKLLKDYPDFSNLDAEVIENHLAKHIQSESLRQKILALFSLDIIQKEFRELEFQSPFSSEEEGNEPKKNQEEDINATILNPKILVETMIETQRYLASYILLGGYVVLLESPNTSKALKEMMIEAVGREELSKNTKVELKAGVKKLSEYLESNPGISLNWTYFNNKNGLEQVMTKMLYGAIEIKDKHVLASSI